MGSDSERKGNFARRTRLLRLFFSAAVVLVSGILVVRSLRRADQAGSGVLRLRARLLSHPVIREMNQHEGDDADGNNADESWVLRGAGAKFAILTGFSGSTYDVIGRLSTQTKAKYASWYGYAYFLDNDLLREDMTFSQKSASRIALFRRHWEQYEWLLWTDADVLITNPNISFQSVINEHAPPDSDIHVIMSKDWGGRQVNPGVSFVRTSPQGKAFVDRWEKEIEENEQHDDLLAIRDGMEKKAAPEMRYVKFVKQRVLNSYPELELNYLPYDSSTVEHDKSHDLWKRGDLFVHVVNCLRQSHIIDPPCCDGIAAHYWREFHLILEAMIDEKRKANGIEYKQTGTIYEDWTVPFASDLGLL